jgi:hypothetical protein
MLIEIDDELFRNEHSSVHVPLTRIVMDCVSGRHVATVLPNTSNFASWVMTHNADVARTLERTIAAGSRAVALFRPKCSLRIIPGSQSNFAAAIPRVTVSDAQKLLSEPFRIFVEDEFSDREFIISYCTIPQKRYVQEREDARFLIFEHGAGSRLFDRLERFTTIFPRPDLLCAAVFDSDAWEPGTPSESSERVRELCKKHGIYSVQLPRRTMENYITKRALNTWTYKTRESRKTYHSVLQAFVSLSVPQQSHYNMRNGFTGDASTQGRTSGALYSTLAADIRDDLGPGFGTKVTDCFENGWVQELDARRDGMWGELSTHIDDLQRLMS